MNELMRRLLFLPEQASTFARSIDYVHYFIILTTMVASAGIGLTAVLLFVRYRRRREGEPTPTIRAGLGSELLIFGIPLTLFLVWFGMGYYQYLRIATPPADAMEVYVMAKQWMWKFAYPGGPNAIGVLRVPAGRPVTLLMTSRDVIHSFFVPAFRVKQDVLPGRYTTLWFEAPRAGRHQIMCAEYCGLNHSQMWGEVLVMEPHDFDEWLYAQRRTLAKRQDAGGSDAIVPAARLVDQGRDLAAQVGCLKCHSVDGSRHIGPSWRDLYGRRERLKSGRSVLVDEEYITRSMMDPMADVVLGYTPVMPTFQGQLSAAQTAAIVEYIKSLRVSTRESQPLRGPIYEPIRGH